jgi:response regulator NasT
MSTERSLRIAVADDEPDMRLFFREVLPRLGHEVVAEAADGNELIKRCQEARPDLIITDIRMPGQDGIAAVEAVNRNGRVPVILITAHHDTDVLSGAGVDYIMAYLAKPVKPVDLQAAIRLALLRFEHFQALARETSDLRQALEDRKVIERAKGAVMKRVRLEEAEAFRRLRKLASNQNRKLTEVAQRVITAEETFRQLEE